MKTSEVTACFIDHGLFLPLALKCAETFKRVLYWTPTEEAFRKLRNGILGEGFDNIERAEDPWLQKGEIDLYVFPDIQHSGMQLELESQGKGVWGSRRADSIELDVEKFLHILGETGLDVPPYRVIDGMMALRNHLINTEDVYIKISPAWRGDFETAHWRSWEVDEGLLDCWSVKFGPAKELIRFIVFDAIETDLEIGGDTYCVDGQWPDTMLHGIEWKDKAYFGAATKTKEMPQQLQVVLDAFGPVLAPYRYRNQWSMEVRVKGERFYFNDPTTRGGLPSTPSQMTLWTNIADILWGGANGELVQPEYSDEFSMECVLTSKSDKHAWGVVEIPKELEPHVKLGSCCQIDGRYCFPQDDSHGDEIGWLVATGKTPQATLDTMKEYSGMLPDGVSANVESLSDILKEIQSAESEGIEFSKEPLPTPAEVVQD